MGVLADDVHILYARSSSSVGRPSRPPAKRPQYNRIKPGRVDELKSIFRIFDRPIYSLYKQITFKSIEFILTLNLIWYTRRTDNFSSFDSIPKLVIHTWYILAKNRVIVCLCTVAVINYLIYAKLNIRAADFRYNCKCLTNCLCNAFITVYPTQLAHQTLL